MTSAADRLAELRLLLSHLEMHKAEGLSADRLAADLSLRNDLLFSLMMVAQLVVDLCAQLSSEAGLPFADYTEAIDNLARQGWPQDLVRDLRPLAGFRNVLVHEYVRLDYGQVLAALDRLSPVEEFVRRLAGILGSSGEV
jgi:uncharacterized protein YutE (UPF0331/DUF86 family)